MSHSKEGVPPGQVRYGRAILHAISECIFFWALLAPPLSGLICLFAVVCWIRAQGAITGGIAGMFASTVTAPLDLFKVCLLIWLFICGDHQLIVRICFLLPSIAGPATVIG